MRAFVLAGLLLGACTSASPPLADALARGDAALAAGKPGVARIHYMNAAQAAVDNRAARGTAHIGLARAAVLAGDGVAATAALDHARNAGADTATIGTLAGEAWLLQGRPDEALAALRLPATLRNRPHIAEAARLSANAELVRGNPAAAMRAFDKALAAGRPNRRLLLDVAAFHFALGRVPAAGTALNAALAIDPDDAEALTLAGHFARSLGGPHAALPWLNRAVSADLAAVGPRVARASALRAVGRARAALADTRVALAAAPDLPEARFVQAEIAADARRFALARALLARVGPRLDDRVGAPLLAARVDWGLGNRAQAEARLRALLVADPGHRPARMMLDRLAGAETRSSRDAEVHPTSKRS